MKLETHSSERPPITLLKRKDDSMRLHSLLSIGLLSAALPFSASGEDVRDPGKTARQVSTHVGEMTARFDRETIDETLRFEPFQLFEEMFLRDDVVYIMRHGPTDWSKLDAPNVAPNDCASQRVMIEKGIRKMQDFGSLLAHNDVVPSRIVVSQWCRNQQTIAALQEGYDRVDPTLLTDVPVRTDPELNLLLSLQGAKNTTDLRQMVSAWDGDPDRKGPLLIISHFTNIEELTQFGTFEGEILVLDPKRDNQVLGTVRLSSAAPDVGHFASTLDSPLLYKKQATDMISRYYAALNESDSGALDGILTADWVDRTADGDETNQDTAGFLSEVSEYQSGLDDATFTPTNLYVADETITVIGTITGTHTGELFGISPTNRDVSFGAIAVHRLVDGRIAESWQMPDKAALIEQISQ
ncbi:MAG: ester cyclase [Pseudomonadota bacterium]